MILSNIQKRQALDFHEAALPSAEALMENAIEFIKDHFGIDEIFDEKTVDEFCEEWAEDNGWTKTE